MTYILQRNAIIAEQLRVESNAQTVERREPNQAPFGHDTQ